MRRPCLKDIRTSFDHTFSLWVGMWSAPGRVTHLDIFVLGGVPFAVGADLVKFGGGLFGAGAFPASTKTRVGPSAFAFDGSG